MTPTRSEKPSGGSPAKEPDTATTNGPLTTLVMGTLLTRPGNVRPQDIDSHDLQYQIWKCVYSIRNILLIWTVLSVAAAVAWFIIFNQAQNDAANSIFGR